MTKPMLKTPPTSSAASPAGRDDRIEADLVRLAALDLTGLRRRWRIMVGRPAPDHLPRALLHRLLAYRVQAVAFGDLDRGTARQLDRLGEGETNQRDVKAVRSGTDAIRRLTTPANRPGTLLVREWQGRVQQAMVLEDGFAWNGSTYSSLSKVARAITGTNWNGPRFFGLRGKPTGIGACAR